MDRHALNLDVEQLLCLASILLGAAYADGSYDGAEAEEIGDILHDLIEDDSFPDQLADHIDTFDLDAFELDSVVDALSLEDDEERQAVLALVHRVTEADDVHDLEESDYIERLADLMGVEDEYYDDYIVDVIEVVEPPPLPDDV
jgi:uncharacterized tellurite resistance protein B-like protein